MYSLKLIATLRRAYIEYENQIDQANARPVPILSSNVVVPPKIVDVHLGYTCQLKCLYCDRHLHPLLLDQVLNASNIVEVLEKITQFKRNGQQVDEFHFAGRDTEPLLNLPALSKAAEYLHESQQRKTALYTNGIALNSDRAQTLIKWIDYVNVSLDASDAESYKNIKGANAFEKVMKNISLTIQNIRREKIKTLVNVSFVLQDQMLANLAGVVARITDMGVSNIFIRTDIRGISNGFKLKIDKVMSDLESLKKNGKFRTPIIKKFIAEYYLKKHHCFSQFN